MTRFVKYVLCGCALIPANWAEAERGERVRRSREVSTLAVIGDTPYGAAQLRDFPALVSAIDADWDVDTVVHVGDIKTGSSVCSDEYFETIYELFSSFEDPLVFTPGDNEWTDCHRKAAGKYDPLERLEALRELFYPTPGLSLGSTPREVLTQAWDEEYSSFVENQLWAQSSVVFSVVHVVGSNNGLDPWFSDDATDDKLDQPARREAEVQERIDAALEWLTRSFEFAKQSRARGVVLVMQADTWDAGRPLAGFSAIVEHLAELAGDFKRPVLLIQGDSHRFLVDQPLLEGDPIYAIERSVPNLTRIVIEGETSSEWLKLRIDPRDKQLFSWERMTLP